MRAVSVTVISGMMIACTGCSSWLPKADMSQSIEIHSVAFGPRYTQNGHAIDYGDMADKLEQEPKAVPHVDRARGLRVAAILLAGIGGALVGWPLGQWLGGDPNPNWKLAAIGGGAIVVGIPLGVASDMNMDSGVEAHNERLVEQKAAAVPVKTASSQPWKPGERAGAPSRPRDAFGFVFDASKADAAAACVKAGYEWIAAEGFSRCTGTPSATIAGAPTQLEFVNGRLSTVEIVIAPPNDAAGWADTFKKTESALTGVYGKPTQRSFVVPDDCKAEESFLGCIADGKVSGSALWYLDAGYVATLVIVAQPLPSASTLHVRIGRPRTNP